MNQGQKQQTNKKKSTFWNHPTPIARSLAGTKTLQKLLPVLRRRGFERGYGLPSDVGRWRPNCSTRRRGEGPVSSWLKKHENMWSPLLITLIFASCRRMELHLMYVFSSGKMYINLQFPQAIRTWCIFQKHIDYHKLPLITSQASKPWNTSTESSPTATSGRPKRPRRLRAHLRCAITSITLPWFGIL